MEHTSPHTISSSGRCGKNLELPAKSTCLISHFYSIIGMVRRLPKNGIYFIVVLVFKEPKLHNSTSKSGHIYYAEKLKIAV